MQAGLKARSYVQEKGPPEGGPHVRRAG